jgi:archaellum component FlaC
MVIADEIPAFDLVAHGARDSIRSIKSEIFKIEVKVKAVVCTVGDTPWAIKPPK